MEDSGIGFEGEHAERVFAPSEGLHGWGSYEGKEAGLAIRRRVVERHVGAMRAPTASRTGSPPSPSRRP